MKTKLFIKSIFVLLIFLFLAESVLASMRCGTTSITSGQRNRISQAEVERLCGPPYSKSGGTWIYLKGNRVYRLKFTEGGLREIFSEMQR